MTTLPPLKADVTDPTTARMCQETGHSCPACPERARDLGATAHNALGAVRAALGGTGSWERARRKLDSLQRSLEAWQASVDEHFTALNEWRDPGHADDSKAETE